MSKLVKTLISTSSTPRPAGPYSQAVVVNNMVYVSGQIGMDKDSLKLVPGGAAKEMTLALINLENILKAAGSSIKNVVKVQMYLKDINDFAAVNVEYQKVFGESLPARSCFQVEKLPLQGNVGLEAIAVVGDVKIETVTDRCDKFSSKL